MQISSAVSADHVHVHCPRCGADDAAARFRLVVSHVVTCRHCGMHYVQPRVSSDLIERKLQMWAEQDVLDPERLRIAFEPASVAYYGRFLGTLTRCMRLPGRRLLDVGCGTGGFLAVARDAGWQGQGIEIGRASARYASQTMNLNVTQGTLYGFEAPAQRFDAVAMIEVIEHLEHPAMALSIARRMLAPDGALLVTTPNFDSLYRRLFGNRWWVINCEDEHIVLFSRTTLVAMLEENGFEVVSRQVCGIDLLGMLREARLRLRGRQRAPDQAGAAAEGYYEARSSKNLVKGLLRRIGVLGAVRALLRAADATYTMRFSPTRDWGEQLVVVARRKAD